MWTQVPDVTIINEASSSAWWRDWLPVITAIAVFVGGTVWQFFQQRREFDNRKEQWTSQQQVEREGWAEARDAERHKQLLSERHRAYASFIAALDDAVAAAVRTAETAHSGLAPPEPTPEHLNELLDRLGTGDSTPPRRAARDLRWTAARDAAEAAGAKAALLANDDHRGVVIDALWALGDPGPDEAPTEWYPELGVPGSGPRSRELRNARNEVERIARKEIGVARRT